MASSALGELVLYALQSFTRSASRMEAWIRVMVQIIEKGVAALAVTPNDSTAANAM